MFWSDPCETLAADILFLIETLEKPR